MKLQRAKILCAPYCNLCRAGIAYSISCKVFTLSEFLITFNRWNQIMFRANNEIMVRKSNLIFHMHKQRSLFLCSCDTNWSFSFVINWMKSNFLWPQNCSNFLQSSSAGTCKLCRNMRWSFGILGFVKFDRCQVDLSYSKLTGAMCTCLFLSSVREFLGSKWR